MDIYFSSEQELFNYLLDTVYEDEMVSAVIDIDMVRKLFVLAIDECLRIGIIDIDPYEYDDAYIFTLTLNDDEIVDISVEKAKTDFGYVCGADKMYIDKNLSSFEKYILAIKEHPFKEMYEINFITFDNKINNKCNKYNYHNKFEDNNRFAEFTVSSNVKDFVDVLQKFFEDYF